MSPALLEAKVVDDALGRDSRAIEKLRIEDGSRCWCWCWYWCWWSFLFVHLLVNDGAEEESEEVGSEFEVEVAPAHMSSHVSSAANTQSTFSLPAFLTEIAYALCTQEEGWEHKAHRALRSTQGLGAHPGSCVRVWRHTREIRIACVLVTLAHTRLFPVLLLLLLLLHRRHNMFIFLPARLKHEVVQDNGNSPVGSSPFVHTLPLMRTEMECPLGTSATVAQLGSF